MRYRKYIRKFLIWRYKYITDQQFKYILSIIIGLGAGLGAVTLKNLTHLIESFVQSGLKNNHLAAFFFVTPILGFGVVYLIKKYVIKKPIGHGIPATLFSLSKKKGIMPQYQMWASILTAPITVGFGGSVGLEGPTVATGSAIGSNLSRLFHLNQKTRTLLIGCAAAGAMSSIFKAPIAAIVFAIEIFSLDLTIASLIPLLLASISAVLTSYFFFGDDVLFHVNISERYILNELIFYLILGVFNAYTSVYFSKLYFYIAKLFKPLGQIKRFLVGGLILGVLVFLIPPLYGEGYETINLLLVGDPVSVVDNNLFHFIPQTFWAVFALLFGLILFKVIAMSVTFGAGGVGGVFAPTLFTGSLSGFLVAYATNYFEPFDHQVSIINFAMVGMAGLMAGVLQAPLTAIFLIAEITGGYELFIPLMVVTTTSYLITKHYIPHNIYAEELAKKGALLTHDKDKNVLLLMEMKRVIERNFVILQPEMSFREMLKNGVSKSNRNLFPVVNSDHELLGVILMDDIRNIMFDQNLYDTVQVEELMHAPPAIINYDEDSMHVVMEKFKMSGAWNLPVVKGGKYDGFISKSKLLTAYRNKLIQLSNT